MKKRKVASASILNLLKERINLIPSEEKINKKKIKDNIGFYKYLFSQYHYCINNKFYLNIYDFQFGRGKTIEEIFNDFNKKTL